MKHSLIIVGGGAAGLTAALIAKDSGIDVAIIEGTDRIGKKILTTGNGRCNISNENINNNRYHSDNPYFFEAYSRFFYYRGYYRFFRLFRYTFGNCRWR